MPFTLAELLALTPARSLRAIATHLGVRRRTQADKAAWRAAILAYWQQPSAQGAVLAPALYAAYAHLRRAGQLPAALFWAEYGALRLPAASAAAVSPWQAPQTISEALYYQGLLYPIGHRQIEKAPWLTTPIDVAIVDPLTVTPLTTGGAFTPTATLDRAVKVWPLLHDVAQYLIYRQQQPTLALLHDHWLSPSQLQALNQRLLRPAALPLPRSHKATPVLAWLTFLAQAAGLVEAIGITARGWQWLAAPPAQQLRTLWTAWWQADQALRLAYHQPTPPAALAPCPRLSSPLRH